MGHRLNFCSFVSAEVARCRATKCLRKKGQGVWLGRSIDIVIWWDDVHMNRFFCNSPCGLLWKSMPNDLFCHFDISTCPIVGYGQEQRLFPVWKTILKYIVQPFHIWETFPAGIVVHNRVVSAGYHILFPHGC